MSCVNIMIVDNCGPLKIKLFMLKIWQIHVAGKVRKIAKNALFNLIFHYSQSDSEIKKCQELTL